MRTLQRVVRATAPGSLSGDQARSLVALFGQAERAAASGIALCSPVVLASGAYTKEGYASAPDWLSAVAGSSAGAAKSRLAAASAAAAVPELAGALHEGSLSVAELQVVAETSAVDPGAPARLLPLLGEGAGLGALFDAATALRAAARSREDEQARRTRVHARRHLRWHQEPTGGIKGAFFCDEVAWAKVAPRLEADAKARWKRAGGASGESFEAHRLDAFLALLGAPSSGPGSRAGAKDRAVIVIQAEALRRGQARPGELCEIEGIGPVSVEAASELIGEASLQFVVRDGLDIATVTGSTRALAQRLEIALLVRDRTCVVPGCARRRGLQSDHCWVDYADDGPTELANLARLCAPHHDLKTNGGWRLSGGPGHWSWDPPKRPPSAGAVARARRVAAAKAKAKRNRPLRD